MLKPIKKGLLFKIKMMMHGPTLKILLFQLLALLSKVISKYFLGRPDFCQANRPKKFYHLYFILVFRVLARYVVVTDE